MTKIGEQYKKVWSMGQYYKTTRCWRTWQAMAAPCHIHVGAGIVVPRYIGICMRQRLRLCSPTREKQRVTYKFSISRQRYFYCIPGTLLHLINLAVILFRSVLVATPIDSDIPERKFQWNPRKATTKIS